MKEVKRLSAETVEKISEYLGRQCFVLKKIDSHGKTVTGPVMKVMSEPYITSRTSYTVVYVPDVGPIHVEAFREYVAQLEADATRPDNA